MDRRMMMGSEKITVKYELPYSAAYSYIRINGEGEKLTGSGEIKIRKGDFIFCYAYSAAGSYIEKDGKTVSENHSGSAEYSFYPKADARIEAKSGGNVPGMRIMITER